MQSCFSKITKKKKKSRLKKQFQPKPMIRLSWRFFHHQMMEKTIEFLKLVFKIKISETDDEEDNNFFSNPSTISDVSKKWWRRQKAFLTHLWHLIYQIDDEEDNKNFSNPFAKHKIYITICWQILRHFSSTFWRCGNRFCSLINLQGLLNEFLFYFIFHGFVEWILLNLSL